jgi:hypothetical protein
MIALRTKPVYAGNRFHLDSLWRLQECLRLQFRSPRRYSYLKLALVHFPKNSALYLTHTSRVHNAGRLAETLEIPTMPEQTEYGFNGLRGSEGSAGRGFLRNGS